MPKNSVDIVSILVNPPNHILEELLQYFKGFQGFEYLKKTQLRKGIIDYLIEELRGSNEQYQSMDIMLIINEGWDNNTLTDTCPRDQILRIIKSKYQD